MAFHKTGDVKNLGVVPVPETSVAATGDTVRDTVLAQKIAAHLKSLEGRELTEADVESFQKLVNDSRK